MDAESAGSEKTQRVYDALRDVAREDGMHHAAWAKLTPEERERIGILMDSCRVVAELATRRADGGDRVDVREVTCPACGAIPGEMCLWDEGPRLAHHAARVAAKVALEENVEPAAVAVRGGGGSVTEREVYEQGRADERREIIAALEAHDNIDNVGGWWAEFVRDLPTDLRQVSPGTPGDGRMGTGQPGRTTEGAGETGEPCRDPAPPSRPDDDPHAPMEEVWPESARRLREEALADGTYAGARVPGGPEPVEAGLSTFLRVQDVDALAGVVREVLERMAGPESQGGYAEEALAVVHAILGRPS